MTPQEAMRHQIKALKGKSVKEKVVHIATYFHRAIIGIILAVILVVTWAFNIMTEKDIALSLACVNSPAFPEEVTAYANEVSEYLKLDTKRQEVYFDMALYVGTGSYSDSYETMSKIFTMVAAEQVDMILGDYSFLQELAYSDYFEDLTLLLTPEQISAYQDRFLYVDLALMERIDADQGIIEYPDPTDYTHMEKPIPVMLLLPDESEFIQTFYPNNSGQIAAGIVVNTHNMENAWHCLEYILKIGE